MSLINQMLKDLEQRNASADGIKPLAGEVRSVQQRKASVLPALIGILVVILAGAAGAWWKFSGLGGGSISTAPVPKIVPEQRQVPVAPPAQAPVVSSPAVPDTPPAASAKMPAVGRLPGLDKELRSAPADAPSPLPSRKRGRMANDASPAAASLSISETPKAEAEERPNEKRVAKAPATRAASLKSVTSQQKSENFYKQAVAMLQQGRVAEARTVLWQALDENPVNHDARQLLVGLLVESKRSGDALGLLQDGVRLAPEQTGFVMALARLQVEAGDRQTGLKTLEQGLKYADGNAEYQGFYAALLQRDGRHEEAVTHYLAALRNDPANTSWLVGVGISLQAQDKVADAREAFERARQTGQLTPELSDFVDQRLKQLQGK